MSARITVTDEMIEQGREALTFGIMGCGQCCGDNPPDELDHLDHDVARAHVAARAALEAAAPLIAAQALRDLADEWREAYSADIFPCGADDLRHINATSGPNSTAKVAAYFARHWADVLSARADEAEQGGQP